jgi:hypothetical protein
MSDETKRKTTEGPKTRRPKVRRPSDQPDRGPREVIENPFETFTEWNSPEDRAYDGDWPAPPRLDAATPAQQS